MGGSPGDVIGWLRPHGYIRKTAQGEDRTRRRQHKAKTAQGKDSSRERQPQGKDSSRQRQLKVKTAQGEDSSRRRQQRGRKLDQGTKTAPEGEETIGGRKHRLVPSLS